MSGGDIGKMGYRLRRTAFTLVELLVVIVIVVLLVSLLIPSLARAREQSRQQVCRNNIRGIWTGILLYAQSYADHVPFTESYGGTEDPFGPSKSTFVGNVLLKFVDPGVWRCPSAILGYPRNRPPQEWKITYGVYSAGAVGYSTLYEELPTPTEQIPGTRFAPGRLDGRPVEQLESHEMRYGLPPTHDAANWNVLTEQNLSWKYRLALITDMWLTTDEGEQFPHSPPLDEREDMGQAVQWYNRTYSLLNQGGRFCLFADAGRADLLLTRY